jgi:hypothetical protein
MSRFVNVLLLSCAMLIPQAIRADGQSYYDADHKDYHVWNAQEEQAYRRFLEEKKIAYHDWSKASQRERQEYWDWRHRHPN